MTFYPDTSGAVSSMCFWFFSKCDPFSSHIYSLKVQTHGTRMPTSSLLLWLWCTTIAADLAEWQRPAQPSEDGSFQKLGLCPIYF